MLDNGWCHLDTAHMSHGSRLFAFMIVCTTGLAPAQTPQPADTKPQNQASQVTVRGNTDPSPRNHQTAEDLLRALQSTKPVNEVILPASRAGKGPIIDRRTLLPEGTAIVESRGRLVRHGEGWAFHAHDGPSLRVLSNAQLELLLAMQADAQGMDFVVSGEVTLFSDQNYLLIKHAERGKTTTSGSESTSVSPAGAIPADASAEDVLSALLSQRPDSGASARGGTSVHERPGGVTVGGLIDGALVVRRPGRLLRDGTRWMFKFDDSQAANVTTLEVLPNQSLEIMVSAGRGSGSTAYLVSGETTQFEQANYLLIRGVTRLQDTGNLRP